MIRIRKSNLIAAILVALYGYGIPARAADGVALYLALAGAGRPREQQQIAAVLKEREWSGVVRVESDARAALEMIMAVHESERLKTRVYLPMVNRDNPYSTWRREEYGF